MQMLPIGIDFGGNEEAALDFQLCSPYVQTMACLISRLSSCTHRACLIHNHVTLFRWIYFICFYLNLTGHISLGVCQALFFRKTDPLTKAKSEDLVRSLLGVILSTSLILSSPCRKAQLSIRCFYSLLSLLLLFYAYFIIIFSVEMKHRWSILCQCV